MAASSDDNKSLALFCDFENIALGVRDAKYQKFDIHHVLEKLLVKGSIVVKKAYCDWTRYKDFKAAMHEASFELIDIPHVRQSGKNSADIRMVVDALDLCYTKAHVDTFVIISGDSDFSPLVSKLRENAKTVIGVGVKNSTSDLLIGNCDEFIYYDDLVRQLERKRPTRKRAKKRSARSGKVAEDNSAEAEDGQDSSTGQESATGQNRAAAQDNGAGRDGGEAASSERPAEAGDKASTEKTSTDKAAGSAGKRKRGKPARTRETAETAENSETAETPDAAEVVENCDEESAGSDENGDDSSEERIQEGLDLLLETAADLSADRDGDDKLWGSMVKQTLKRRRPGFNESYYGFDSFGRMLEEAQSRGFVKLELDDRSGGYIIRKVRH